MPKYTNMKQLIALEEVAIFFATLYLYFLLGYSYWLLPVLIFLPDLSMLGYISNPKFGSQLYNFWHHRAVAIIFMLIGVSLNFKVLILIGLILFLHSTIDRVMGYGLKYPDDFKRTHLGRIGE